MPNKVKIELSTPIPKRSEKFMELKGQVPRL